MIDLGCYRGEDTGYPENLELVSLPMTDAISVQWW